MKDIALGSPEDFCNPPHRREGTATTGPTTRHWLHPKELVDDTESKIPQPPEEVTYVPRRTEQPQVVSDPLDAAAKDSARLKHASHLIQDTFLVHIIEGNSANHMSELMISKRHPVTRGTDKIDVSVL